MNLLDSSFLCLDIGTYCVRGIAHRIRSARIDKSAFFTCDSSDTTFAIKTVVDELERQLGTHFDSAYITGNMGQSGFDMVAKNMVWTGEHKITSSDIRSQVSQITPPDGFFPLHIIPLQYCAPNARNMLTPIGHTDHQLISAFGAIYYSYDGMNKLSEHLRGAHIQPDGFYDLHYIQNIAYRQPKQTTMFIDFGSQYTTASIWTDRGPVCHTQIERGGIDLTTALADSLHLDMDTADRIKRASASLVPNEMNRFLPADTAYAFSRGDVNDIVLPILVDIIAQIKDKCIKSFTKYRPTKIILTGGGSETDGLRDFIENAFAVVTELLPVDASVRALSEVIWNSHASRRERYIARHARWQRRANFFTKLFNRRPRPTNTFIPILPSSMCFDMTRADTYTMFKSGGISMIHIDIMDGFYVDRIVGSIDQIRQIRSHTNAHLHVHLMTESPNVWAADAVAAGADTIIMSTNTSGLRNAIRSVRAAGRRAGIALNPESSVSLLKPILREIDEIMIMSVAPGAAGQDFDPGALHKISVLAATRKKYDLKFIISVDGGINDRTAALCWDAGADRLISGSYLARASDFPLAVRSLLPNKSEK